MLVSLCQRIIGYAEAQVHRTQCVIHNWHEALQGVNIVVYVEVFGDGDGEHLLLDGEEGLAHSADRGLWFHLEHEFADVKGLDARHRWTVGTEYPMTENSTEAFAHVGSEVVEQPVIAVTQIDVDETVEGGIVKELAFCHLGVKHLPVVVGSYLSDDVSVGRTGLEDDMARAIVASGTSSHLAERLECALIATEVGEVEHGVGIKNAHNRNVVEVEAFSDHLGTDEDVGAMVGKVGDDGFVLLPCLGCVEIHTEGCRPFKQFVDLFFNLFRACTHIHEPFSLTRRALCGDMCGIAAIVAGEGGGLLVEGEGHVAVGASGHPSALLALNERRVAATILKENDLFFSVQCFLHDFDEARGEHPMHEAFSLCLFGINDFDGGQHHVSVSLGELHVTVTFFVGKVVHFERRGGGAKQRFCSAHLGEHDGGISGVIARGRLLLFVALFVLFVHDDESEVLEREEHAGAHAEDELIGCGGCLSLIDFEPLYVGELGMIDTHAIAEESAQPFGDLGGEGNFGQEVEHLFPFGQMLAD